MTSLVDGCRRNRHSPGANHRDYTQPWAAGGCYSRSEARKGRAEGVAAAAPFDGRQRPWCIRSQSTTIAMRASADCSHQATATSTQQADKRSQVAQPVDPCVVTTETRYGLSDLARSGALRPSFRSEEIVSSPCRDANGGALIPSTLAWHPANVPGLGFISNAALAPSRCVDASLLAWREWSDELHHGWFLSAAGCTRTEGWSYADGAVIAVLA